MSLTNAAFRKIYGSAYLDLVNHAPYVLGYLYDMMDRPRGPKSHAGPLPAGGGEDQPPTRSSR